MIETRRVPSDLLVPRHIDNYVDIGLQGILTKLAWGRPLILRGPKGSGKTLALEQWACKEGVALVRQDCTEETSVRDLIGTVSIQDGKEVFALGALTTAIEVANEDGGALLVLEEINALPPGSQKILNSIADYRQEVNVPKIGRSFRVNRGNRIWIVGTMNPNYGGTYGLNEDFRSRFGFIDVPYMPEAKEKALLLSAFSTPPSAIERNMVDKLMTLAQETRSGKMEYSLSTRDLVHFIDDYERLGRDKGQALKILEGKFEGEHIDAYRKRVQALFDINITETKLYA
jgi:MoxR-like ATPase